MVVGFRRPYAAAARRRSRLPENPDKASKRGKSAQAAMGCVHIGNCLGQPDQKIGLATR